MDGRKSGSDFGIRTYFDMFQKMEDTFKFCAECKKLPSALPDPKSLRRCKRYAWEGRWSDGAGSAPLLPAWCLRRSLGGCLAQTPTSSHGALPKQRRSRGRGWQILSPAVAGHVVSPPRCQNVYYCGVACQRANWPLHKKFCKKLKLVALDRLVEWLIFTGGQGTLLPPSMSTPQPARPLPLAARVPSSWL